MKQKIVLATGNKGKVKEMADVLSDFGFEVIAQTDLGIESPEETGLTFVENALLKARYASEKSGLPAIADDSGLVVSVLNGAPGLYSARYAGEEGNDAKNHDIVIIICDVWVIHISKICHLLRHVTPKTSILKY